MTTKQGEAADQGSEQAASGGATGQRATSRTSTRSGAKAASGTGRKRASATGAAGKKAAANYVLRPFSKEQQEVMEFVLPRAADAVEEFVRAGIDAAMNKFNGIL